MSIERHVVPGLFPPPDYAHVAVADGRLVLTAGGVPLDRDGALVGRGDYGEQTRRVIANLLEALEAGGAAAADVAKTTVYVVTPHDRGPLAEVWEVVRTSSFAGAPSTLLGVSTLGYEGQLVEIEALAVVA